MITLGNGHKIDFCCASGALGFDGRGWWFEQPARWFGWLRPLEMTIITKTLTRHPRAGNYRWWKPWRCVRLLRGGGTVNAVKLTNPGITRWIDDVWPRMKLDGYKTVASFMPETIDEASTMLAELNWLTGLVAVELNLSCPNIAHKGDYFEKSCEMIDFCKQRTFHPLIVKLGVQHDIVRLAQTCKPAAWDLINSVPWQMAFPGATSPLERYGIGPGGVSGPPIREQAREALCSVREMGVKTPIISGGGIDSQDEVECRLYMGADAIAFGTMFIRKPWLPNQIIRNMRGLQACQSAR